jgi:hypothetical protein
MTPEIAAQVAEWFNDALELLDDDSWEGLTDEQWDFIQRKLTPHLVDHSAAVWQAATEAAAQACIEEIVAARNPYPWESKVNTALGDVATRIRALPSPFAK